MYEAHFYIQPMMELAMNKKIRTGLRSKSWLQTVQILGNLNDKFNLRNNKYQRKSKRQERKSKCWFQSEKRQSNPFRNQWWTIISVKEPLNNNFNTSKLISVWNKNKESSNKKKAEWYKSLKGSKKSLEEIKITKKGKVSTLLLKRKIQSA